MILLRKTVTLTYTYDGSQKKTETITGLYSGVITQNYRQSSLTGERIVGGITTPVAAAANIKFDHDPDGRVIKAGALTIGRANDAGQATSTALGLLGQLTSTHNYDPFGFVEYEQYNSQSTTCATPYAATYVRDLENRITAKTETICNETTTHVYRYDAAGRLWKVYETPDPITAGVAPTVTDVDHLLSVYDYDSNGNRLGHQIYTDGDISVENGSYGTDAIDAQDRMRQYGNSDDGYTQYSYWLSGDLWFKLVPVNDGNGVYLYDDRTDYVYDSLGNLKTVRLHSGTADGPEVTINYKVDGLNRRVARIPSEGSPQYYLYKNSLNPIAELNQAGEVISRFVYGTKANVPDYMESKKEGTWKTYRIISNHLGSPVMIIDTADGSIVQRYEYDEYGNETIEEDDTFPPLGFSFQPFGFAGGLYDDATKLVRFGARDYDPRTGRWTAKDPIRFAGDGPNLYGYVLNDPVNSIDSSGKGPTGSRLCQEAKKRGCEISKETCEAIADHISVLDLEDLSDAAKTNADSESKNIACKILKEAIRKTKMKCSQPVADDIARCSKKLLADCK